MLTQPNSGGSLELSLLGGSPSFTLWWMTSIMMSIVPFSDSSAGWNYKDTDWGNDYPYCNGNRQSPINIQTDDTIPDDKTIVYFKNYDHRPPMTLENNGHTVTLNVHETDEEVAPSVMYNYTTYRLVNIHFHWSDGENAGSEHSIDGERATMEMHMVHVASWPFWGSPTDKLVIAMLFNTGDSGEHLDGVDLLTCLIQSVADGTVAVDLEGIWVSTFLPADEGDAYIYQGSLTTPPCTEDVIFVVFTKLMSISDSQLQEFLNVTDGHGEALVGNWRPLQPQNSREVLFSKFRYLMT